MSKAIESALFGGESVEVIIIDDGSVDDTLKIAKEYETKYPSQVRAIHQENGGHGEAVNTGLREATGQYFKVLDSDDWLDPHAFQKVLKVLTELVAEGQKLDMFVANYVYEKLLENTRKVIDYDGVLPQGKVFTWDEVGHFKQGRYLLMHSVIYRTSLLRDCQLKLPAHTFYVDNIFIYQPLKQVKYMYYMNEDLYRYFIGRQDQSVTEENMIKRIDQQLLVTKYMIDCCDVMEIKNKNLRNYLIKHMGIMMTVSSVYLIKEGSEVSLKKRDDLWDYLKAKDIIFYKKVGNGVLGKSMQLNTKAGHEIVKAGYTISEKIFKFG